MFMLARATSTSSIHRSSHHCTTNIHGHPKPLQTYYRTSINADEMLISSTLPMPLNLDVGHAVIFLLVTSFLQRKRANNIRCADREPSVLAHWELMDQLHIQHRKPICFHDFIIITAAETYVLP